MKKVNNLYVGQLFVGKENNVLYELQKQTETTVTLENKNTNEIIVAQKSDLKNGYLFQGAGKQ